MRGPRKIYRMDVHFTEMLEVTANLKPDLGWVWWRVALHIGSRNGAIDEGDRSIARSANVPRALVRKVIPQLVELGLLYRTGHGQLGCALVDDQLAAARRRVDLASTASARAVDAKSTTIRR